MMHDFTSELRGAARPPVEKGETSFHKREQSPPFRPPKRKKTGEPCTKPRQLWKTSRREPPRSDSVPCQNDPNPCRTDPAPCAAPLPAPAAEGLRLAARPLLIS